MREIKFRLRNRFNEIVGYEKWYTGHWHPDDTDKGFSIDSGYWEAQPCWLYSTNNKYWMPTYIPHSYKEFYIGLRDKTGVEIYEGDIVSSGHVIKWDNTNAMFALGFADPLCFFPLNSRHSRISDQKIIGNI